MRPTHGAILAAALLVSLALAGCGSKDSTNLSQTTAPPLAADKGAISGLVIDDVYRPVPGALVLIQEAGLTATSDGAGQFTFVGLEPGAYVLKVQAEGHASAPRNVDVVAGEYAEVEVQADRLFNEGSRIVTTQYTIFMTCTIDAVVVSGNGINCFQDQSGDSERTSFDSNLTQAGDVRAMVTEIKFNQEGTYNFVVAIDDDGDSILDRYWAENDFDGDYGRIVLKAGEASPLARNEEVWKPWVEGFTTTVFVRGLLYDEIHGATAVPGVTRGAFGVGASFGLRGEIVQSVFIGEPTVDLDTYAVLS